jgi:hypothetical protein
MRMQQDRKPGGLPRYPLLRFAVLAWFIASTAPAALATTFTFWLLQDKLTAGWGEERVGSSVTVDACPPYWVRTVSGAPADYGTAYVFGRGDDWSQTAELEVIPGGGHDNFGTAVDFEPMWLAVGAPNDGTHGCGFVRVYELIYYEPDTWWVVGTVCGWDAADDDRFGLSTAVCDRSAGDEHWGWCVIGAPYADDGATEDAGAVYLYQMYKTNC